ncbi:pantetheine-phosphate adenylyltransferase [Paenalkalicoccus suaedae]|uniref:Phosphopantetheine adenylyltransferase n=1 Tax=Paenalkalicoccus suaedae TaxID=2592382 RepID=A0A859FF01_9BACI|nr:pantetheine-phosphate adenylyltransferase [Paenalkalicoccus suaedae]QKS71541.1 pantetheine-phosphate adenylyltransferase [Paenalkalicoccus suaedae]
MKTALVPGSFDPITAGHVDIIKRAATLFDHVVVAVLTNSKKQPLFSTVERKELIRTSLEGVENVSVEAFDGLLMDIAKQKDAVAIVKGLRSVTDFEYEAAMSSMNQAIDPSIQTVFLQTDPALSFVSSSIVKEVAKYEALPENLVPPHVADALRAKFADK